MKRRINKTLLTGAAIAAIGLAVTLASHHALAANDGCAKVNQAQGAPQSLINQTQQAQGAPQDLINKTQMAQGAPQNIINQARGGGAPQSDVNQASGGGGGVPKDVLNSASTQAPREEGQTQVTQNTAPQNPADCK